MGDSLLQKIAVSSKALRMRRLFRPDGRVLLVAMDHAAFMGPADGLDLPTMCAVVKAGADAVMTTYGTARRAAAESCKYGSSAAFSKLNLRAAANDESASLRCPSSRSAPSRLPDATRSFGLTAIARV